MYGTLVRATLAVLLFFAAAAKSYDIFLSTPREVAWFDTAFQLMPLAVVLEVSLAIWLVAGGYPALSWWFTVLLFLAMGVVNVFALRMGWPSCGCFGALEVPPSVSLACNVVALLLLATIVPPAIVSRAVHETRSAFANTSIQIAGLCLAIGVVPPVLSTMCFGSFSHGLAYLSGHRVYLYPQIIDAGVVRPSKSERTYFTVWNRGREPIRVIGGTSECTCVATRGLPVTVPPGGSGKVAVDFAFVPATVSRVSREVKLFVDAGNWLVPLQGTVKARLVEDDDADS